MSVRVMQAVWQHSQQSGGALVLLLAIADNAHDDGDGAYPSIATLAQKARMTGRNVNLLLKQLQQTGEIQIRPGAGPRGCNVYRVCLPGLATPENIVGGPRSCEVCGTTPEHQSALHRHHKKPRAAGGGDEPSNILVVCEECHRKIHGPGWLERSKRGEIFSGEIFSGESSDTRGVKNPVGGGEKSGSQGVKPTSPKPLVNHQEPSEEPSAARATRRASTQPLPDDFPLTPERRAWLAEHRPDLNPELAHAEFCTYWWSVRLEPRGKKSDWEMTWRNGMLRSRSVQPSSTRSPNGKVNPVDAMAALARQFREEEARESRDVSGALDATFTVRAASH